MNVTWKLHDGSRITAEVADGTTLMQAALNNQVPGVIGECGGCMSCGTCHVHVHADWRDRVGAPEDMEDMILDIAPGERTEASRLSCQLTASPALDGLVLYVPES